MTAVYPIVGALMGLSLGPIGFLAGAAIGFGIAFAKSKPQL